MDETVKQERKPIQVTESLHDNIKLLADVEHRKLGAQIQAMYDFYIKNYKKDK